MITKKKVKKETLAQKAYRLLSSVPKTQWRTKDYTDGKSKCCFAGHYVRLTSDNPEDFSDSNCSNNTEELRQLHEDSIKFLEEKYGIEKNGFVSVNDYNTINGYTQKTIKYRNLKLLEEMIEAGY